MSPETPADLQVALSQRYRLRRVLGRGGFLHYIMPPPDGGSLRPRTVEALP